MYNIVPKQEIKIKALELALKITAVPCSTKELVKSAKEIENYLDSL